jgi:hypothetical protein
MKTAPLTKLDNKKLFDFMAASAISEIGTGHVI